MFKYWKTLIFIICTTVTTLAHAITSDTAYQAGLALYDQGHWQQSIEEETEAVRLDPENWKAYQVLGYDYYRLDNEQMALDAFDKSININPDNVPLEEFLNTISSVKQAKRDATQEIASVAPPLKGIMDLHNFIYIDGGFGVPVSPTDFTSVRNVGYSFGVGLGGALSKTSWVVLDAHYSDFSINTSAFPLDTITGGDVASLLVLLNIKSNFANPDNPVSPYIIGGAGISELWNSQATITSNVLNAALVVLPAAQTDFAFRFGLGVDIILDNGNRLFFETNVIGTISNTAPNTNEADLYEISNLGFGFSL